MNVESNEIAYELARQGSAMDIGYEDTSIKPPVEHFLLFTKNGQTSESTHSELV